MSKAAKTYADGSPMQIGDTVTLTNGEVDARETRYIGEISVLEADRVVVDVDRIGGELIADCVQTALYKLEDAGLISQSDYEYLEADLGDDGDYKEGGEPYQFVFYKPERDLVKY